MSGRRKVKEDMFPKPWTKATILVACEESQTVAKAFWRVGIPAVSCDVQAASGGYPSRHLQGDALSHVRSGKCAAVIAHPPCTYLSRAGARWMYAGGTGTPNPERLAKAMEARKFFLQMLDANAPCVAVENPRYMKICNLPPHTQTVQPYEFGDPWTKATHLWLKGLPPLLPTNVVNATGGCWMHHNSTKRARSKTFTGIATAMAEQWGPVIVGKPFPARIRKLFKTRRKARAVPTKAPKASKAPKTTRPRRAPQTSRRAPAPASSAPAIVATKRKQPPNGPRRSKRAHKVPRRLGDDG